MWVFKNFQGFILWVELFHKMPLLLVVLSIILLTKINGFNNPCIYRKNYVVFHLFIRQRATQFLFLVEEIINRN